MADRLTQLQDCYDQLATQFYASIRYISLHHSASPLPPPFPTSQNQNQIQPSNGAIPTNNTTNAHQNDSTDPSSLPAEQRPDTPTTFAAAQRELAHDLLLKTRQIEAIIGVLPGVENSLEVQEQRIRELEGELREARMEREDVEKVREEWVGLVEGVIGGIRR
ncbi:hypothetical protein JMJ35_010012 [Cladonia borealis]|uniref:Mediator of RNA polymerase II transcription subunit 21 n=1 Tax=Cladonia borealis TaxID=184061 RepID=A0AA39QS93_9LECA|nr:hypothetical protein JMJ35_010012 [Cladonia borealis]